MRYAIFSDIHNHVPALATTLNHAAAQKIDAYFCLGDVGIDECIELVRQVDAPTVFGNWEASNWRYLSAENQKWALALPAMRKLEDFWLTHAAPFWPAHLETLQDLMANPYRVPQAQLFPYLHIASEPLWQALTALTEAGVGLMFHGHTHRQVVWRFDAANQLQKVAQQLIEIDRGDTLIVGVGSVGRPLDGAAPAYAIFDSEAGTVELLRVD